MALDQAGGGRRKVAFPEDLPIGVHRHSLAVSATGEGAQVQHPIGVRPQKRMRARPAVRNSAGLSDDPSVGVYCCGLAASATGKGAQIRHTARLCPQKRMRDRRPVNKIAGAAASNHLTIVVHRVGAAGGRSVGGRGEGVQIYWRTARCRP